MMAIGLCGLWIDFNYDENHDLSVFKTEKNMRNIFRPRIGLEPDKKSAVSVSSIMIFFSYLI